MTLCPADQGKVRKYTDKTRYVACAVCGTNVQDPNDYYADHTGGPAPEHEALT